MILLLSAAMLSACGNDDPVPSQSQRIALDRPVAPPQTFAIETEADAMEWQVGENGHSLSWGASGGAPQLTQEIVTASASRRWNACCPIRPGRK